MPNKKKSAKTKHNLRAKKAVADVAKVLKTQKKLELELSDLKKQLTKDMMTYEWGA
jgi:ABC-type taurine transport system substrate-binding protein